jgi:hypothetical protein
MWDSFEIWVEDGALCIERFAVSIGSGGWIEQVCEMELGLGSDMGLVLEDENLMFEESFPNNGELGI